jgi:hypothetical protein
MFLCLSLAGEQQLVKRACRSSSGMSAGQILMYDGCRLMLKVEVTIETRTQVSFAEGGQRIFKKTVAATVHFVVSPRGAVSRLPPGVEV